MAISLKPWLGCDVLDHSEQSLPVKLTEDEHLDRARSLGQQDKVCGDMEADQKEKRSEMRVELDGEKAERTRLAAIVRDGAEPRPVNVTIHGDFKGSLVYTVRNDTGELVSSRAMSRSERQIRLLDSGQ